MLTVKSPNSYPFEKLEGKDVLPVLIDGISHIGDRKHWLSAGTLLGLHRDGDFMPYDTDLDVAVIGSEEIEMPDNYLPIRFIDLDDKPMQRAYLHKPSNIIFDIFHYHVDGDQLYNTQEKGRITRSKRLTDVLDQKRYLGTTFYVPCDIEAYLTEWYGNWKIPNPSGKTEWHK